MAEKKNIEELRENADFIRRKLEESREEMENQPIVIEYDNGGGQSGIRENPAYSAYEKLLKSYQSVLKQMNELTAEEPQGYNKNSKLHIVGKSKWKQGA